MNNILIKKKTILYMRDKIIYILLPWGCIFADISWELRLGLRFLVIMPYNPLGCLRGREDTGPSIKSK